MANKRSSSKKRHSPSSIGEVQRFAIREALKNPDNSYASIARTYNVSPYFVSSMDKKEGIRKSVEDMKRNAKLLEAIANEPYQPNAPKGPSLYDRLYDSVEKGITRLSNIVSDYFKSSDKPCPPIKTPEELARERFNGLALLILPLSFMTGGIYGIYSNNKPIVASEKQSVNDAQPAKGLTSLLNAPAYKGPDRVNLTSGYHVGGANNNIDKILLHITDSEGKSAENWFHDKDAPKQKQVSAHYIIEKDGKIIQIVPENKIAFHCRSYNKGSIGIEFVGKLSDTNKKTFTDAQMASGVKLVAYLQQKYGISDNKVYGHRNFASKECPGAKNLEAMKAELSKYSPK